jgi:hypothetical protein
MIKLTMDDNTKQPPTDAFWTIKELRDLLADPALDDHKIAIKFGKRDYKGFGVVITHADQGRKLRLVTQDKWVLLEPAQETNNSPEIS